MEITIVASEGTLRVLENPRTERRENLGLANRIQSTVSTVTEDTHIYTVGVRVTAEDVADANFLLPMILLAVAEYLSASIDEDADRATFSFSLKASEAAVLCFKVSHIQASSPAAISLAVEDILRRSKTDGEYVLDRYFYRFGDFLTENNLYNLLEIGNHEEGEAINKDAPLHPGIELERMIARTDKSKTEIAALAGISRQQLYDIVNGNKPMSPTVCARFGKLFGNGTLSWALKQATYDAYHAEKSCALDIQQIPTM